MDVKTFPTVMGIGALNTVEPGSLQAIHEGWRELDLALAGLSLTVTSVCGVGEVCVVTSVGGGSVVMMHSPMPVCGCALRCASDQVMGGHPFKIGRSHCPGSCEVF